MSGKFALIIGNTEYTDPGLAQLTAPGKDAEDFAGVLKDHEIGAFDSVNIILNQSSAAVNEAIDEFFDQKKPDDLLVLYFSGHGVRDELGSLYLAVRNTIRTRLRSTAIKSDYIREVMDQSRSRRQVLILDCCNSGAFALGTKAATGVSIGTATAFESGYGRIILTASDATQFAWEGDKVIGETDNSLFTHYLVEGLKGDADQDSDGRITVDELYDYAYEQVKLATPKQTPSKFSSKQQGEIVLRQNMRIENIKLVSLPDQLISEIENPYPEVRMRAVGQLSKLLNGRNLGLARSAREALERMEKEDDSRRVSQVATQALESIRQIEMKAEEERRAREEAERLAMIKPEEERLAGEKAESERKVKEDLYRKLADHKTEEKYIARTKVETERPGEYKDEKVEAKSPTVQKGEEQQFRSDRLFITPSVSKLKLNSNTMRIGGIITVFVLLVTIGYFAFKFNMASPTNPATEVASTNDIISIGLSNNTPAIAITSTKIPSKTPTITPRPTATFTPMATKKLSFKEFSNNYLEQSPPSSPLGDLEIIYPKGETTIDEKTPTIMWEVVPNAAYYLLTLSIFRSDTGSGFWLESWITNSTSFTSPTALSKGKPYSYNLSIAAYTEDNVPLAGAGISFSINGP